MLKKDKTQSLIDLNDKWFQIIHNDLYNIRNDIQNKNRSKKEKDIYEQLRGLRDSILYDACSGVGYIFQGKFYNSITEIDQEMEGVEVEEQTIELERVMSVEYLLRFIDQILER